VLGANCFLELLVVTTTAGTRPDAIARTGFMWCSLFRFHGAPDRTMPDGVSARDPEGTLVPPAAKRHRVPHLRPQAVV
jgi:hypothetical protein